MTEPFPYRCEYGYMCSSRVDFATFAEALAFCRGYNEAREKQYSNAPRVINHTNIDGADDAKPWAQAGLTEDEWEQIENL